MHELAVCQALMQQVDLVARERRASRVTAVILQIGPLSGVEPRLLADAFSIAAAGSVAAGAELRVEHMAVRVRCSSCGAETETTGNRLLCGECGDFRTRVVSGEELLLKSLELEIDDELDAPCASG